MNHFLNLEEHLSILAACMIGAYLLGSVNLTIAAARIFGISNLKSTGSGNPGATNLFRAAGAKVAVPVLILEIAKACLALLPARFFLGTTDQALCILPFLFGNLFPVFHRFKGGKGVAAAVGAMLAADYRIMLLAGIAFIATFILFRRVSVGSLTMVLAYPVLIYGFHGVGVFFCVGIALAAVIFTTHRANIGRLVRGEEPRLMRSKK
jgi:glycerol-3-phosphate acyltransferase PlsY